MCLFLDQICAIIVFFMRKALMGYAFAIILMSLALRDGLSILFITFKGPIKEFWRRRFAILRELKADITQSLYTLCSNNLPFGKADWATEAVQSFNIFSWTVWVVALYHTCSSKHFSRCVYAVNWLFAFTPLISCQRPSKPIIQLYLLLKDVSRL